MEVINEERIDESKNRLFVDMDGTLAIFTPVDQLETLYEEGYFYYQKPLVNVIDATKDIIVNHVSEVEVFILSAYLTDSQYALQEKNEWLDDHLPELPKENRIFMPCGDDKKIYIPQGIRSNDWLLDDYTKNLVLWQPPARGIKLLNGINHTRGTWSHDRLSYQKEGSDLAADIISIMSGKQIKDIPPNSRTEVIDTEFGKIHLTFNSQDGWTDFEQGLANWQMDQYGIMILDENEKPTVQNHVIKELENRGMLNPLKTEVEPLLKPEMKL